MKTLYIVRHGKSSWDQAIQSDHDRPLLEKGIVKTKRIAHAMFKKQCKLDALISSSAVRAFETAKILATGLSFPIENIRVEPLIYEAHTQLLKDIFYSLDSGLDSVMIVGHNPTFTGFANLFLLKEIDWLPTSAVVCVEFECQTWAEIFLSKSQAKFILFPRMLKND
jgi:phosphohistidine phosphatase